MPKPPKRRSASSRKAAGAWPAPAAADPPSACASTAAATKPATIPPGMDMTMREPPPHVGLRSRLAGHRTILKGAARPRLCRLTRDEIAVIAGRHGQLGGKVPEGVRQ